MILVFTRSHSLSSAAIRLATWSRWSHVALVSGTSSGIDSTARLGVVERPLDEILCDASEFRFVEFPIKKERVIEVARTQLGRPYDWTAVTGIALRRNWQDDDSWFCSELIAWASHAAGAPLFRPESLYRVTPQHLWMLPGVIYGR